VNRYLRLRLLLLSVQVVRGALEVPTKQKKKIRTEPGKILTFTNLNPEWISHFWFMVYFLILCILINTFTTRQFGAVKLPVTSC